MSSPEEHILIGQAGRFLMTLGFVSSLLAMVAYFFAQQRGDSDEGRSWRRLGRTSFMVHAISVFGVIGLIFTMMLGRYFEYNYVWEHVSEDLPFRYIFSAFWEGQEGSFLLWMFWHSILGLILLFTAKSWEAPVMSVFGAVQAILASMLLGFYYGSGDSHLGVSPFQLIKDLYAVANPDYINQARLTADGLNPLLQNYWMTIHPPTLFLGFASTLVPFAYAVAGLWTRRHKEWILPAMPWVLFSGAILGTGIVMGGAWAYEALSFGGYWAWDPVENMSLVPWLIMIAGLHTALIARKTGRSLGATYIFFLLSFLLVVYSTFLTRSGILGSSSVHAFTEMGLEWQLVLFILVGTVFSFGLYFSRMRGIPKIEGEESGYSKEFWLFIGALVLLFSAILMTVTTSTPVFEKITAWMEGIIGREIVEGKISPPVDVVSHHNRYQVWIAILAGLLSGGVQFLRYKDHEKVFSNKRFWLRGILPSALLASIFTLVSAMSVGLTYVPFLLMLWAGAFTFAANADYLASVLRFNMKLAGSALSHMGFGLLLWGVFYSGALKEPISVGFSATEVEGLNPQNNQSIVVPRGQNIRMKEYRRADGMLEFYEVNYTKDYIEGNRHFYELNLQRKTEKGEVLEAFTVTPNVIFERKKGQPDAFKAANPSTQHYWSQDVFCLAVPDWAGRSPADQAKMMDSIEWKTQQVQAGDTIFTEHYYAVFEKFDVQPQRSDFTPEQGDIMVAARFVVHPIGADTASFVAQPLYVVRGNAELNIPDDLTRQGLKFKFLKLLPADNKAVVQVGEYMPNDTFVIMQAIIFPGIKLVWLGKILMMFGLGLMCVVYAARKFSA